jgi:hypothetical protein
MVIPAEPRPTITIRCFRLGEVTRPASRPPVRGASAGATVHRREHLRNRGYCFRLRRFRSGALSAWRSDFAARESIPAPCAKPPRLSGHSLARHARRLTSGAPWDPLRAGPADDRSGDETDWQLELRLPPRLLRERRAPRAGARGARHVDVRGRSRRSLGTVCAGDERPDLYLRPIRRASPRRRRALRACLAAVEAERVGSDLCRRRCLSRACLVPDGQSFLAARRAAPARPGGPFDQSAAACAMMAA